MSLRKILIVIIILCLLTALSMPSVVGASNEHHVNPGESIQTAVDAADAGDVVIVHEGTYFEELVVFGPEDSGITLVAEGLVILFGTGYEMGVDEPIAITIASGTSGVTIDGFHIVNYRSGIVLDAANDNVLQNNVLQDNGDKLSYSFYDGINLANAHNNQILNNKISNCEIDGIWLGPQCDEYGQCTDGSTYNTIMSNQITDCHGGVILDTSHHNEVINNKVSDATGEPPDQGPGIFVGHTASYNTVSGNKISGCNDGINVGNAQHNQILKNTITDSSAGIFLGPDFTMGTPSNNTVGGNVIANCGAGIGLANAHYNTISNNKMSDIVGHGIFLILDEFDNSSTNNTVLSNNISNCRIGINLEGIADGNPESNTIENNKVKWSEVIGIRVASSENNTIRSNKVSGSGTFDLFEKPSPPNLNNAWIDNKYMTSNW